MKTIRTFMLALLVAGGLSAVQAEVLTEADLDEFEAADYDGNACIDAEEFRNLAALVFHGWDSNHDGHLSGEEIFGGPAVNETVNTASVTAAAYQKEMRRAFELSDKDDNGCLTRSEWGEYNE